MGLAAEKYYTIKVGVSEPQEVLVGQINKTNGLPEGTPQVALSVLGAVALPNYSRIYAKRERSADNKPTGRFEPKPWGAEGAEITELRFLPNCNSLDKLYQESIGLKAGERDGEIILANGINDFDVSLSPLLVQMLKLHTFNGDNVYRDPSNQSIKYHEYDEAKVVSKTAKSDEQLYEAMQVVMSVKDNTQKLKVLAQVHGMDGLRQDAMLVADLLQKAKTNPGKFLEDQSNFSRIANATLVKANDFQLLDLALPGEVRTVEGELLLGKISKSIGGMKKLEYMASNVFDHEVFDAVNRIAALVLEKEKQLN
jgi:hypothetical protein